VKNFGRAFAKLIRVRSTRHPAHYAQDVVVQGVDSKNGVAQTSLQMNKDVGIVNAGEVGHTGRLHLSGEQRERIGVDETTGDSGEGLPRNHKSEITALTNRETIVIVKGDLNHGNGVLTVETGVVEPILTLNVAVALSNPEDGLNGVVKIELKAIGRGDGQTTLQVNGELLLDLSNEILVGELSEAATLISVQKHIVNIQEGIQVSLLQGGESTAGSLSLEGSHNASAVGVDFASAASHEEILHTAKLELKTHLVVLKGNQGQGKTSVAVKPKLQGGVETTRQLGILNELSARKALSNHLLETTTGIGSEFLPNFQKLSILLINGLTSNQDGHTVNDGMTNGVGPVNKGLTVAILIGVHNGGQIKDKVDFLSQITTALNDGIELLSEPSLTLKDDLNGFLSKVGMTTIHSLEKGHLRVRSNIHILGTHTHEGHQSSTCHFLEKGCVFLNYF
jgi:hypothetical protein